MKRTSRHMGPGDFPGSGFFLFLFIFLFFPVSVLGGLPRTGQVSCFNESGTVVDHAGTGQDGDLQAGEVWPDPRFSDNGDGTVTDHLTGLIWLQDGGCLGTLSWQGGLDAAAGLHDDAKEKCQALKAQGEWQLPEIAQLESLFNAEEVSASTWLNRKRFKDIQPGLYWSRTPGTNQYAAWAFDFATGEVRQRGKVEPHYCLLVRSLEKKGTEGQALLETTSLPSRFVDNGDGTVTDKQTGLMWLKDGACLGRNGWQQALDNVGTLNKNPNQLQCRELRVKYDDWALPNRHELRSLVDHRHDLPALPPNHLFTGVQTHYWSSTTMAGEPSRAYELVLTAGSLVASDKGRKFGIWAVRPADGRPDRKRLDELESAVAQKDVYLLLPVGPPRAVNWPPLRFTDHGDGTITDNITGLMWMQDGKCFSVETWINAQAVIDVLNTTPEKMKACEGYTARYGDWQLPDMETMMSLVGAATGEPAAWLNSQGTRDILARDYWVREHNFLNLYFAWAINLRQGTTRNYPQSFQLNVWPVRIPLEREDVAPAPLLMGNEAAESLTVQQGKEFLLTAAVDNVKSAVLSVFRLWYVAPDGKSRWLSSQGEWVTQETDMFVGRLFKLDPSLLYRGDTTDLALGEYIFYFSIQPQIGENIFSSQFKMAVVERLEETASGDEVAPEDDEDDTYDIYDEQFIKEEVLTE